MKLQVALPLDHPEAEAFMLEHFPGRDVLTVPVLGEFPKGQCYQNVRSVVGQLGGSLQPCWLLSWYPDHFIEALHHAVWLTPDGDIVDVSQPAYPLMPPDYADIILDIDTAVGQFDPGIPSIFRQIDQSDVTAGYIRTSVDHMMCVQRRNQIVSEIAALQEHSTVAPDYLAQLRAAEDETRLAINARSAFGFRIAKGDFGL